MSNIGFIPVWIDVMENLGDRTQAVNVQDLALDLRLTYCYVKKVVDFLALNKWVEIKKENNTVGRRCNITLTAKGKAVAALCKSLKTEVNKK